MIKLFSREDFIKAYRGKRVLILGNTGFKGSWLSLWLSMLGANVYGYALEPSGENSHFSLLDLDKKTECYFGDIRNLESLKKWFKNVKPDYVFHLAAQAIVSVSYNEPKLTFDTNVGGSVNVLEAIRENEGIQSFIYVTSDKCYKNKEWLWGYRENDELGGLDPYSASKACAELVFSSYKQSFFDTNDRLGISSVRAGNVIGGGDWAPNRIVPDCARAIISGKTIEIRNPGATRPWQHVLEPLSGYLTLGAMQYGSKKLSDSWNFGPDSSSVHTVQELVELMIKKWGKGSLNIVPENKFYESMLLKLDCDKAAQRLGWQARWKFEETVTETVNWYSSFAENEILSEQQIEKYMKVM